MKDNKNIFDNEDFDSIDNFAKNAFEDFEVAFDPMDWVDMQNKLRAESSIDTAVKKALKNYTVPFDEEDWKALEQQLDDRQNLRPYIGWIKSAEAGVIALLIFSMFNLPSTLFDTKPTNNYDNTSTLNSPLIVSNLNNNSSQEIIKSNQVDVQSSKNKEKVAQMSETVANETVVNNSSSRNQVLNNNNSLSLETSNAKLNNSNKTTKNNFVHGNTSKNNSVVATSNSNGNDVPNQTNFVGFAGKDGIAKTATISTIDNFKKSNTALENYKTLTANSFKETQKTEHYATDEIAALDTKDGIKTTDPGFELKKVKLEFPYNTRTFLGGAGCIGANFANSMGGTSVGYGLGFTLDSELSAKFALRTGLFVSYKGFEMTERTILDKTTVDGNIYKVDKYQKSNLVMIEIPLDLQYTFFKNEKWRIFAIAGLTANFITSKTDEGTISTNYNGLSITTDINTNDFKRGLLEGGVFAQNAYLSVGAGLGLERQLSDKVSLYIMPVYRHAVTPIGSDFMSSFNVNIGFRTSL